jgi:enamine deaminase RidA (YjgF/YER057c/UK114 family)
MERLCSGVGSTSRVCRRFNLIHLPGRLAKKNGELWCGKLGEEIAAVEGKQAARSVAIELLATLQAAIGDLNDVRRIVKLLVVVSSGPHFTEAHMVANGASEVFIEVFEEREAHARSALGVSQIPFGCCVEVEMVVEIFASENECEL